MGKHLNSNGNLYSNGTVHEIKLENTTGTDIRIKATGTGSCKLVGKLTANGDYKTLSLVRMSDFAVTGTITDNEIYATDVTGIYSISLANATGFTNVWVTVLE